MNVLADISDYQLHFVGHSFGDALRCGAIIKDRALPDRKQLAFVERDWPFGAEVIRNLAFVDEVVEVPKHQLCIQGRELDLAYGPKFKELPIDYESFIAPYFGVSPDGVPLDYELSDFKQHCDLPDKPYVVMQPFSRWNKGVSVPQFQKIAGMILDKGYDVVLLGGGKDEVPETSYLTNLIGKTSVAESIWVAANAQAAVGVESWCASFLPMMGKPSVMLTLDSSRDLYGERWQKAWPSITLASESSLESDIATMLEGLH